MEHTGDILRERFPSQKVCTLYDYTESEIISMSSDKYYSPSWGVASFSYQVPLLLTWLNFISRMDMQLDLF